MHIVKIRAREILDSRATPTIEATVTLENGVSAQASAPSGASTGSHEAHEKRDGGERFLGKGVLFAVESVNGPIFNALKGMDVRCQSALDRRMAALDGSGDKSVLGANAIIAVSLACARCAAVSQNIPLYRHIGGLSPMVMPRVMMNVLNGGAHSDNNIDIQEFMLVPKRGLRTVEAVRMCAEIYLSLGKIIKNRGLSASVGDEGGYAPNLERDFEALDLLVEACDKAGYAAGNDVFFALDLAASGWYKDGSYTLPKRGERMERDELISYIAGLCDKYPIISVEDGLSEDDFDGFRILTERLGDGRMVVGDDLFVTNPVRIAAGVKNRAANAVLIKPNQIGTLTETLKAVAVSRSGGMRVVASHRSGDTSDDFLADLAVGACADFIKSGAPARAERTSKYNRLLAIADEIEP